MNNIKDRELLAFSNATNLDWQFLELTDNESKDSLKNNNKKKSYVIKDLLTPESFVREDAEGNFIEFPYMKKVENRNSVLEEDKKNGFKEMQNSAGLLMNYLEECDKNSNEGNFLKDWEVVYGADNYKVVADYLDTVKEIFKKNLNEELKTNKNLKKEDIESVLNNFNYKSREEIGNNASFNKKIDLVASLTGNIVDGLSYYFSFGTNNILKSTSELIARDLAERTGSVPALMLTNGLTEGSIYNVKVGTGVGSKVFSKDTTINLEGTGIKFTEELEMAYTGFKVAVFKNGKNLVIAYKCKEMDETELLPSEINYLQIIYSKMKDEHPDVENIVFTGYNGGGDLSNLSVLLGTEKSSSTSFYTDKIKEIKGFINFTPEDFDKQYNLSLDISIVGTLGKEIGKDAAKAFVFSYMARGIISAIKGGVNFAVKDNIYGLVASAIFLGVKCGFDHLKNEWIKEEYQQLIEKNYIKSEENGIKGYISADFLNDEKKYEILKTCNGKEVKVDRAFKLSMIVHKRKNLELYTLEDFMNNSEIIDGGNLLISEKDSYFMMVDDISPNILRENMQNPMIAFIELSFIKLSKIENETYFPIGYYSMFIQKNEKAEFYFRKDDRYLGFNDEEYLKMKALLNIMELTGRLQRGYEKNIDKLSFLYVNGSKVDKIEGEGFPTGDIVAYGEENGYISLNEYVFLPFIGTDGNKQDNIRQDYIKNAFKDIVRISLGTNKKHNFYNDNLDEGIFKLFEKDRNDKGIYIVNASNGRNRLDESNHIYFYNKIKEEILKDDLYKKFYTMEVGLDSENSIKKFGKMFLGTLGVDVDYTESPVVKKIKFEFEDGEMHYGFDNNSLLSRENYSFDVEGKLKYSGKIIGSSDIKEIKSQDGVNKKEILENVDIELQV